jgi:6-phospho-beta-glucosidase
VASALAVQAAHRIDTEVKVGCMLLGRVIYPYTCRLEDILMAQKQMRKANYYCGDVMVRGAYPAFAREIWEEEGIRVNVSVEDEDILAKGKVDFFAFSYYSSTTATNDPTVPVAAGNMMRGPANPYLSASEWGWTIDPDGLHWFLNELNDRYGIPLMVVENGLGAVDQLEDDHTIHDPYRIEYLKKHVQAMSDAVDEGVDLLGYTIWGCTDLISASTGEMAKRYGIIYVDKYDDGTGTLNRYKKDSFYWYQNVIRTNGRIL